MAIDVFAEELLTLTEAAKRLPKLKSGKPPHVSTLYRWMQRGCHSHDGMVVRLETVKIGGTTCTSLEALQRFFDRLSGDTTVVTPLTPTMRQREKERERRLQRAEEELRRAGI
jgi:hypothetical protein